jgi:hypothetical protein
MASLEDAFAKFAIWKELRMHLRVTTFVNGVLDEVTEGRIFGYAPDASQVGVVRGMHDFVNFDLGMV